jgi:hypothetical protein
MKLVNRSAIALLFLTVLAVPALSQNLAVRINPPPVPGCFPVTIKNLRSTPLNCTSAVMLVIDQSNCKTVCKFGMNVNQTLGPCQSFSFKMCCTNPPLPPKYIIYVRVAHALGYNEQWFYRP